MHVVVVGGGIGGLACAQGFRARGVDVTVVERDTDLARTAGYKLHLGAPALAALGALLPPALLELLHASAVATHGFTLAVRDHRARLLVRAAERTAGLSLDVDRVTLRVILATGLADVLLTGRRCTGWRQDENGATVTLDDGSDLAADLVVLADGAGSALAGGLVGQPTSRPTGFVGIAGSGPLDRLAPAARHLLDEGPLLAIGPGGLGLFATPHDPGSTPAARSQRSLARDQPATAIWGLLALASALPHDVHRLSPAELASVTVDLLAARGWSDDLASVVAGAATDRTSAFTLHASDPRRLAPWRPSRVTALGDAVHAMPPTGGQGAATAILDAAALVDRVARVDRAGGLVAAVGDFEAAMRAHSRAAVEESIQPLGWIRALATPVGDRAARLTLPVVASVARGLRRLRRSSTHPAAGRPGAVTVAAWPDPSEATRETPAPKGAPDRSGPGGDPAVTADPVENHP